METPKVNPNWTRKRGGGWQYDAAVWLTYWGRLSYPSVPHGTYVNISRSAHRFSFLKALAFAPTISSGWRSYVVESHLLLRRTVHGSPRPRTV